ncbi:hypothetical protein AYI68_g399 [Smittium mucronatum]|uniref:Uncharacterized protein n=1 Tax=Smittium mucronatum TaxID=133383 RepID=A0A1R0H8G9_9FUNG|nr:hypothetical protein AYI68_g399 [Smittium mucronatum]
MERPNLCFIMKLRVDVWEDGFPWNVIPASVKEEVLYISIGDYEDFKSKIATEENVLQTSEGSDQQESLTNKFQIKQDRIYLKKGQQLLLYPQLTELKEAILKIHSEKNQNVFNTFKTLKSNYYAPGAYPIVKTIVEFRERCQRNNYLVRRSENFHGTQVSGPFQKWGIDVAGPMPTT